jgi:VanZ family protein
MHPKKLIRFQWPGILWAIMILILTGVPGNFFNGINSQWVWPHTDKIVHWFIFAVFSFLLLYGHRIQYPDYRIRYKPVMFALALGIAFSAVTELLQQHVFRGREGDFADFLANVAGTLSGALIFYIWYRKKTN